MSAIEDPTADAGVPSEAEAPSGSTQGDATITGSAPASASNATNWAATGAAGAVVAGRAIGRAAAWVGRSIANGYRAVDPDVRRHVAEMPLLGLMMLTARERPIERVADDGHRPILLVHGLGGHRGTFLPMRAFLRLSGRRRVFAVGLPSGVPIEELGRALASLIAQIVDVNELAEDATIDVVAHSMGGLVARLALDDPQAARRVATLVTLGTPHAGTYLARYAATDHTLQLRPGSKVIERLAAQVPWRGPPSLPRLVAFWSDADMLLLPPSSARVEGAENVEMPGFTHYGYLLNPRGFARVLTAIS